MIINPGDFSIELAQVFDTYKSPSIFEAFINNNRIPRGHIIMAACEDDMAQSLPANAKKWFDSMGSKEIWNLTYREGFAFIGRMGRRDRVLEARAEKK